MDQTGPATNINYFPLLITLADGRQRWLQWEGNCLTTGGDAPAGEAAETLAEVLVGDNKAAVLANDGTEFLKLTSPDDPGLFLSIEGGGGEFWMTTCAKPTRETTSFLVEVLRAMARLAAEGSK